jgi:hypothetical protein
MEQISVLANGSERANVKIVEGRGSLSNVHEGKAEEDRKERAEMDQPEGEDIPRFLIVTQRTEDTTKNRNVLRWDGDRETKHEKRIEVDKEDIETI